MAVRAIIDPATPKWHQDAVRRIAYPGSPTMFAYYESTATLPNPANYQSCMALADFTPVVSDGVSWAYAGFPRPTRWPGETDDTAAIQRLLDRGGPAYFPSPTTITSPLEGALSVQWEFAAGAYIDASALTGSQAALTISGTVGSALTLSSNAVKGATSVVLSAATGVAQYGLLKVYSTAVFDAARTSSMIGELVWVKSVAGTTATLASGLNDTYNTAATAAVRVITPLHDVRLIGLDIRGAEGSSKYLIGLVLRACVEPRVEQARVKNCSGTGIRLSDCMGGAVDGPFTEISSPSDTGYGVVFAHATRGARVTGHVAVMNRHAVTTGNSNTAGFEGIPRDCLYENATVFGTQTSLALNGGDGLDTHCAADGITFRNCTVYNSSGRGVNLECPNATLENIRIFRAAGHGISAFNISDRDGAFTFRNIEIDGCLRPLQAGEGFNSATGALTRITIDGFRARAFTQSLFDFDSTFATPTTVLDFRGIDADATSCAVNPVCNLDAAAELRLGPSKIANVAYNYTCWSIEDIPVLNFAGVQTVEFKTGTNSSGIGVSVAPTGTGFTYRGQIACNAVCTATNTATGVSVGANLRGSLRIAEVQGNAATGYAFAAGAVAIPPAGYRFTTAGRPTVPTDCRCWIWDTTLGKPVWEDVTASATDWSDATGADA